MADVLTAAQRHKNMSAIRSSNTKLENKVTKGLWEEGYRFRKNVKDLKGKPDIAIKKYKIVIFIDSCFWHGCPAHGHIPKSNINFWQTKIARTITRDMENTMYYLNREWNIYRIWEHEFKEDFRGSIFKIIEFINLTSR